MIVIRQMMVSDAPECSRLWEAMALEAGHLRPDTNAWNAEQANGLRSGAVLGSVAVQQGAIVGFCDGLLAYEPATRERGLVGRHLFVATPSRGQGLSERLMWKLLTLAKQNGARYKLVHGIHSVRTAKKLLGRDAEPHREIQIVRW